MLRTARLALRPFRMSDAPAIFEFQGDAETMRFTYLAPSLQACVERLVAYEDMRQLNGFAPWTILSTDEKLVLGWGGLGIDPYDQAWGPEVIYALRPSHWGRGLATELVQHTLNFAFSDLHLGLVNAFARPENAASVRVLEKNGFHFRGYEPGLERNHYQAQGPQSAA